MCVFYILFKYSSFISHQYFVYYFFLQRKSFYRYSISNLSNLLLDVSSRTALWLTVPSAFSTKLENLWSQLEVISISVFNPNTGKYGPEITPYLDTFHAVYFVTSSIISFSLTYWISFLIMKSGFYLRLNRKECEL